MAHGSVGRSWGASPRVLPAGGHTSPADSAGERRHRRPVEDCVLHHGASASGNRTGTSDLLDRRGVYPAGGRLVKASSPVMSVSDVACRREPRQPADSRRESAPEPAASDARLNGRNAWVPPSQGPGLTRSMRRVHAGGDSEAGARPGTGPDGRDTSSGFAAQGSRRITVRGRPPPAFDVVGAASVNPARSNIEAVPV